MSNKKSNKVDTSQTVVGNTAEGYIDPKAVKYVPEPEVWTKEELLAYHKQAIKDANEIALEDEDQACFKYCINTSGGQVLLPDLGARLIDPQSDSMITFEAGERINLHSYFTRKAINVNRRMLIGAFNMSGNLFGLPVLMCVKSLDIVLPFNPVSLSTAEKMKSKGLKSVEMPANEYDHKLADEIKKEKEYNDRLINRPGTNDAKITQEEFEAQFK